MTLCQLRLQKIYIYIHKYIHKIYRNCQFRQVKKYIYMKPPWTNSESISLKSLHKMYQNCWIITIIKYAITMYLPFIYQLPLQMHIRYTNR